MRMLLSTEILTVKVHLFEVRAIEGSVVSSLYPSVRPRSEIVVLKKPSIKMIIYGMMAVQMICKLHK